jgi:hypothetical protein
MALMATLEKSMQLYLADESWGLLSARPKEHFEGIATLTSNADIEYPDLTNLGNLNTRRGSAAHTNLRGIWLVTSVIAKLWSQGLGRSCPASAAHPGTKVIWQVEAELAVGTAANHTATQPAHLQSPLFDETRLEHGAFSLSCGAFSHLVRRGGKRRNLPRFRNPP